MFPIRDTVISHTLPVVNTVIIGMNVAVFLAQTALGPGADRFIITYGLIPARLFSPEFAARFPSGGGGLSLFSFMFLHGGFFHLIGNMWSLYIFGDNVEDRLGSFQYLVFYLLGGLVSGLCHVAAHPLSTTPTIGASGAVAGVMGAYFILYPHSRILTLIPIIIIPWFVELPAVVFLGFWFAMQLMNAYFTLGAATGIAWWAHIGGFAFGIGWIKWRRPGLGGEPLGMLKGGGVKRHATPRFQVITPRVPGDATPGDIHITPYEAAAGAKKIINIPWGFYNRFYQVLIPPGTRDGTLLRLRGVGPRSGEGQGTDVLLRVRIDQPWKG